MDHFDINSNQMLEPNATSAQNPTIPKIGLMLNNNAMNIIEKSNIKNVPKNPMIAPLFYSYSQCNAREIMNPISVAGNISMI